MVYASTVYHVRDAGGSSEVTEDFVCARGKAEQVSVKGVDALLFEVGSEKPATDAAMKRFHMPAALKDQHERSGWVQFAPGGIAIGPRCVSVAKATPANSNLTIEKVLNQVASSHIKPL